MEEIKSDIFSLIWSKMPLSQSELDKIPEGHRVRPYLIFSVGDGEYGFPCTSKVFDKHSRYVNDEVYINFDNCDKTLIQLSKVYNMPSKNKIELYRRINKEDENEIIKKIKANIKFSNYPESVVNYFNNMKIYLSSGDVVIKEDKLYNVVDFFKNRLVLVPMYKYPVNNTIECSFDGLKYYADVDNIFFAKDEGFEYCSQFFFADNNMLEYSSQSCKLASNTDEDDIERIHNLASYFTKFPRIKCNSDYSKLYMLEPGMIVSFTLDGVSYKMIIIHNNGNELDVLYGLENDYYKNYKYKKIPINADINYEITGVLDDERFNKYYSKYTICNSLSDLEVGTIFKCDADGEKLTLRVIEKTDSGLHVVDELPGFYSFKNDHRIFHLYDEYMIPYKENIKFEIIGKLRNSQIDYTLYNLLLSREYKNRQEKNELLKK